MARRPAGWAVAVGVASAALVCASANYLAARRS